MQQQKLKIAIAKVFAQRYLNYRERFDKEYVPNCIKNLEEYAAKHNDTKKFQKSYENDLYIMHNYNKDGFVDNFLDALMREECIIWDPFNKIVNLLLSYDLEGDKYIGCATMVRDLATLFHCLVGIFPPSCSNQMHEAYECFIGKELPKKKIRRLNSEGKSFETKHLFGNLMELLLETLPAYSPDMTAAINETPSESWARTKKRILERCYPRQCFEYMPIELRIERLFVVLKLLLYLLEFDFAVWNENYNSKPRSYFDNEQLRPLVVLTFQMHIHIHDLSEDVVRLCKSFALGVEKQIKPQYLSILQRYLSLLVQASSVRQTVITPNAEIVYPAVPLVTVEHIKLLYYVFKKVVEDNVAAFMQAIHMFSCRSLRYKFIEIFLEEFVTRKPVNLTPAAVVDHFKNRRWQEKNFKKSKLQLEQVQDLLWTGMQAYAKERCIQEVFDHMRLPDSYNKERTNDNSKSTSAPMTDISNERFLYDLDAIQNDIAVFENKAGMHASMKSSSNINSPSINIHVDGQTIKQYQADIADLGILRSAVFGHHENKIYRFNEKKRFLDKLRRYKFPDAEN